MATVHTGLAMSLDGFVADRHGSLARLADPDPTTGSDSMKVLIEETGAVIMGRRTYEMAADPDWFVGNYEFQTPIFVLTHTPPLILPKQDERLTFTFVTDGIAAAVDQARAAAGSKAVKVIGASTVQQILRAGLADELHVDIAPVLLGAGLRLFDDPELDGITLSKISVREYGSIISLRYRIIK